MQLKLSDIFHYLSHFLLPSTLIIFPGIPSSQPHTAQSPFTLPLHPSTPPTIPTQTHLPPTTTSCCTHSNYSPHHPPTHSTQSPFTLPLHPATPPTKPTHIFPNNSTHYHQIFPQPL